MDNYENLFLSSENEDFIIKEIINHKLSFFDYEQHIINFFSKKIWNPKITRATPLKVIGDNESWKSFLLFYVFY